MQISLALTVPHWSIFASKTYFQASIGQKKEGEVWKLPIRHRHPKIRLVYVYINWMFMSRQLCAMEAHNLNGVRRKPLPYLRTLDSLHLLNSTSEGVRYWNTNTFASIAMFKPIMWTKTRLGTWLRAIHWLCPSYIIHTHIQYHMCRSNSTFTFAINIFYLLHYTIRSLCACKTCHGRDAT